MSGMGRDVPLGGRDGACKRERSIARWQALVATRHWQTDNTVDRSPFVDYGPAIIRGIGPTVTMYLYYRLNLGQYELRGAE
jgi:hypothetical protein